MPYPDHLDPTEARIIDAILEAALADGGAVSVHYEDDRDAALFQEIDANMVRSEIAVCSSSTLKVWTLVSETGAGASRVFCGHVIAGRPQRDYLGQVYLMHGNGPDVIFDYTDTPAMNALLHEAIILADRLRKGEVALAAPDKLGRAQIEAFRAAVAVAPDPGPVPAGWDSVEGGAAE